MTLKKRAVLALRALGYDLTRFRPDCHPFARLLSLMKSNRIGLVLDVGANIGQYGAELRDHGFCGRIMSFEPLSQAFGMLSERSRNDGLWDVRNLALGAKPGKSVIHIAGNSASSSLLAMLPAHALAAPYSKYVGDEEIAVETLDRVWSGLGAWEGNVWLKLDTQGYEAEVLRGAAQSLQYIQCVQMEMSLIPLYEDSASFEELLAQMKDLGYQLVGLEPGFTDNQSGRLLQVDGVFCREQRPH